MARNAKRLARFEALQTISVTWIVMDFLKDMRVRGPFDGKTGKATARLHRDQLERDAASARARKGAR